jgi:hypothetical protein
MNGTATTKPATPIGNGTVGSAAKRLARAVSGREQARVELSDLGMTRLVADLDRAGETAGVTVVPAPRHSRGSRWGRRNVARVVVGALAATAVASLTGLGAPPRAEAAILPVVPAAGKPIVVTVSGPTAQVHVDVVSTAQAMGSGAHFVWLRAGRLWLSGTGDGGNEGNPALVHVGGTVPSTSLTPGTTTASLTDVGDATSRPVKLTVLRQSRVTLAPLVAFPGGVLVTGRAAHYDIPTGTYRGDQLSTVQVQVLRAGRWVTVQNAPTATDGSVFAVVPAPAGVVKVRLVRLVGANVTGGVSAVRAAVALPVASARGDMYVD